MCIEQDLALHCHLGLSDAGDRFHYFLQSTPVAALPPSQLLLLVAGALRRCRAGELQSMQLKLHVQELAR